MRYQTKLLISAGLLLALSLSAAGLAYWGVAKSHAYLIRSRISHEQLERQLQFSRHSQQLFKAWTDTLLTGMSDRPLGAAYLHKVIESDLSELERLTKQELALVGEDERRVETVELDRLNAMKAELQNVLDQLDEVEQLRSRGRPDIAWEKLIALLKGGPALSIGVLICGFFWEMWNFYSYPKWVYTTPGFEFWYAFEMPLLGYLGYVPFSMGLFAAVHLMFGLAGRGKADYVVGGLTPRSRSAGLLEQVPGASPRGT